MGDLYTSVTATAGRHHGAVSTPELAALGVSASLRAKWVQRRRLLRVGPRSFVLPGAPTPARQSAWCAAADVAGFGHVAGRTAAWLFGLDGFRPPRRPEVLLHRTHRGLRVPYALRTTDRPLGDQDAVIVDGIPCLRADRLIVESHHFGFSTAEIENAIDSAIRTGWVDESALRAQALESVRQGSGGAAVRDALLDTGGESRLERWFLAIVRTGGLPRPAMRVVVRPELGWSARLDATFPGGLVVELEGHATHSSRRQRQHDEERRTALTLAGYRVIVFTYIDVRDRPDWVLSRVRAALALIA